MAVKSKRAGAKAKAGAKGKASAGGVVAAAKALSQHSRSDGQAINRVLQRELKGWSYSDLAAQVDGKSMLQRVQDRAD